MDDPSCSLRRLPQEHRAAIWPYRRRGVEQIGLRNVLTIGGCDHRSARPSSITGASEMEMARTPTPSALGCYSENSKLLCMATASNLSGIPHWTLLLVKKTTRKRFFLSQIYYSTYSPPRHP